MIHYREMRWEDIPAGLRLCRASRWNQTGRDWELFLECAPGGARVAEKDGEVVGTVATMPYEGRFAWVSMVLVDPAQRGQGIGTRLLELALEVLEGVRSVRLDATPAGHPIYQKLGFEDEYGLARMEVASAAPVGPPPADVRPLSPCDLIALSDFDRRVFGADRRRLLEWLLADAPQYCRIAERGGEVVGYTFGRHGHNFEHIGPMVAGDAETARKLVRSCLPEIAGRRAILDIPLHTPEWRSWLESLGFVEQRPFIRMFRGQNAYPGLPDRLFAITGPEFG